MKSMKQKLSSKSGASMLLALVFLLFCLMVGGSVLSAASANGSRAAQKKADQQAYLSQRSASLLLADMLKSSEDSAMQLTVKDVTSELGRTVTFMAHGTEEKSALQMLLYEIAIAEYHDDLSGKEYTSQYLHLGGNFTPPMSPDDIKNGKISIALKAGDIEDTVYAQYKSSYNEKQDYYDCFSIDFAVAPPAAVEGETLSVQYSYVTVSVKCYTAPGNPVTVNGVTTTTTIIRWDDPVIEKGGA